MHVSKLRDYLYERYYEAKLGKLLRDLCGKKIGSGCSRDVYELKLNKRYVVKVERGAFPNGNFTEYHIWSEISEYKKLNKYFAPIIFANEDYRIMIMRRIRFGRKKDLPKKVPHFFFDMHGGNYGWIGKQFVCCDYGGATFTLGWSSKKLKNANWHK